MKILVSACLLGVPCRYDAQSKPCAEVMALGRDNELVPVCPECLGGLKKPRPASEIQPGAPLRVMNSESLDVTAAFEEGARKTLERAYAQGCDFAIMKAKSPSCGSGRIYDGSFTGTLSDGDGVAVRALREAGIEVKDEHSAFAPGSFLNR